MGIPGYTQIPFKNPGTYPRDLSWVGYPPDLPSDTYPGTRCPTLMHKACQLSAWERITTQHWDGVASLSLNLSLGNLKYK